MRFAIMKNRFVHVEKLLKCAFAAVVMLLFSGCSIFDPLPDGKAPDGIILSNAPRKDFDVSSAVNYMTTSLSIYLLTNPLPENVISVDADNETRAAASAVLEELGRITGILQKNPPCPQILKSRAGKDCWDFSLSVNGRTLWKEHLRLTLMSGTKNQKRDKK